MALPPLLLAPEALAPEALAPVTLAPVTLAPVPAVIVAPGYNGDVGGADPGLPALAMVQGKTLLEWALEDLAAVGLTRARVVVIDPHAGAGAAAAGTRALRAQVERSLAAIDPARLGPTIETAPDFGTWCARFVRCALLPDEHLLLLTPTEISLPTSPARAPTLGARYLLPVLAASACHGGRSTVLVESDLPWESLLHGQGLVCTAAGTIARALSPDLPGGLPDRGDVLRAPIVLGWGDLHDLAAQLDLCGVLDDSAALIELLVTRGAEIGVVRMQGRCFDARFACERAAFHSACGPAPEGEAWLRRMQLIRAGQAAGLLAPPVGPA